MPRSRQRESAAKSFNRNVDEIIALLMQLEKSTTEKERQRIEDERAGRTEKRAERRLGIAERGEQRGITAEKDVKTQERMDWAKGQQARLSPGANTILNQSAATRGSAVADVQGQTLAGMKTGQDVNKGLLGIELDTYKAGQLLGTQKKKEGEKEDLNTLIEGLPEPARSRIKAQIGGLDVESSREAYPGAEADDKPSDEWYMKQIVSVLTKTNPETKAPFTEKDAIRMLKLSPEQQMKFFGGEEFDTPSAASGALEGASLGTAAISPQPQTPLSAESQPAPMGEDYNPADHIPAGDTMPVAGGEGLSPEEQTEQDLIKKALSGGGTLDMAGTKKVLSEKGFSPDSIERILQGL